MTVVGIAISLVSSTGVYAQAVSGAGPSNSNATAQGPALTEVLVTATKRTEDITRVPISIEAFGPEKLEASGIKSFADLAAHTPAVEFDTDEAYANIAIRGINSDIGTSTTGIYIDDTPIQTRLNAVAYFANPLPLMFDVDRIEVLRGPQGTLFGAGAEGGAIRFISPDPGLTKYSGYTRAEVTYTKDGAPSGEFGAAVGGPIVDDKLGFRVSAWGRRDGGFVDRVDPFTGETVDANSNWKNSYAARVAFGWAPTDWLRITPSIYGQSIHANDTSAYFEYLSDPSAGEFRNGRLIGQPSTDKFYLPSLKIEADFGRASLISITSYMDRDAKETYDLTSLFGPIYGGYGNPMGVAFPSSYDDAAPNYTTQYFHQLSQELRLASSDPHARLKWTVGAFYSHGLQGDTQSLYSPYIQTNTYMLPPNEPIWNAAMYSDDIQVAGFGQVDWRIIDPLTLTLGLRVSHVESTITQSQSGPYAFGIPSEGPTTSITESPVTPLAALAYQLNPNNMVYFSAGKGYRIGGGNQAIPLLSSENPFGCPIPTQPGPYQSDSLWSYELGAKNTLFNNRLQLSTSVYHVDWKNIQQFVVINSCGYGYIANTGTAVSNGFDVQATARVTHALTLDLSLAYTNAHLTSTVYQYGSLVARSGDVVGTPPWVNAPWDIRGSAEYRFTVFGGHDAYVRAEDIYHSENPGPFNSYNPDSPYYDPTIPPNPANNLLNLRAGIQRSGADVALVVYNALNAHPALQRYNGIITSTLYTNYTFRPLTLGVSASYRF
jgi:outer membrane receptor protein involved in Fe transport